MAQTTTARGMKLKDMDSYQLAESQAKTWTLSNPVTGCGFMFRKKVTSMSAKP